MSDMRSQQFFFFFRYYSPSIGLETGQVTEGLRWTRESLMGSEHAMRCLPHTTQANTRKETPKGEGRHPIQGEHARSVAGNSIQGEHARCVAGNSLCKGVSADKSTRPQPHLSEVLLTEEAEQEIQASLGAPRV